MELVNDNSLDYRENLHAPSHADEAYQVFAAIVLSVDWEREVVTLQDLRTNSTLSEVAVIACNSSSTESTDVVMPEEGSTYLCVPIQYTKGFMQVALLTPIMSGSIRAKDAIGYRLLDKTPGYNVRKRGNYRKAYPGQRSVSMSNGYTEKTDGGWDKSTQD